MEEAQILCAAAGVPGGDADADRAVLEAIVAFRKSERGVRLSERLVTFRRLFPRELGGVIECVLQTLELAAVGAVDLYVIDYA